MYTDPCRTPSAHPTQSGSVFFSFPLTFCGKAGKTATLGDHLSMYAWTLFVGRWYQTFLNKCRIEYYNFIFPKMKSLVLFCPGHLVHPAVGNHLAHHKLPYFKKVNITICIIMILFFREFVMNNQVFKATVLRSAPIKKREYSHGGCSCPHPHPTLRVKKNQNRSRTF